MNDNLGAAPHTEPPAPSLWERACAWLRERRTMSAEELQARIATDFAALSPAERDALIDAHLPPSLRRSAPSPSSSPPDGPRNPYPPRMVQG